MRDLIEALLARAAEDEGLTLEEALEEAGARHARVDLERLREILRLVKLVIGPYPDAEKDAARAELDRLGAEQGIEPAPERKPEESEPAEEKPDEGKPAVEPKAEPAKAGDAKVEPASSGSSKVTVTIGEGVLAEKDFTAKRRRELADKGVAMSDGSFPIENAADLANAIGLWGNASDPAAAKRHIIRRARALGLVAELPDDWGVKEALPELARSDSVLLEAIEPTGRIIDVLAIRSGTSRNRKRYRAEVLREAVSRGVFEGPGAFASDGPDHDPRKRGVRSFVGWWDNARFGTFTLANGRAVEGVAAYFHPTDRALRETLVELLEGGRPDRIGFSIYGDGPTHRLPNGDEMVDRIDVIESIDPVIHPAAGGQAIRLVASEEPMDPCEKCGQLHEGQCAPEAPDISTLIEAAVKRQMAPIRSREALEAVLAQHAGLAEPVKARIRELAEGRELDAEAAKALVEAEVDYVAKLAPAPPAGEGGHISGMKSETDQLKEAAFDLLTPGKPGSIREFYVHLTGDSAFTGKLRESGRLVEAHLVESAIDSTTFPSIMLDAMHKRMVEEYRLPGLDAWRRICSTVGPVSDFRDNKRIRWGGYGDLPAVAEGDPYTALAEPSDEKAVFAVSKRGGTEDLTLETIVNDDMAQMRRIPRKLGRAASRTLWKFVFDFLATNPTIYDTLALFVGGHANLGAAALDATSLEAGILAMRKQAEQGSGERIGLSPRFIVYPVDLDKTVDVLLNTQQVLGSANNDISYVARQNIEPIPVSYWTDANNWFLVGDPAMAETIEVGFLGGREEPELFLQDQPTVGDNFVKDVLTYKIRHIYGGAVLDYRPFYGAIVA